MDPLSLNKKDVVNCFAVHRPSSIDHHHARGQRKANSKAHGRDQTKDERFYVTWL